MQFPDLAIGPFALPGGVWLTLLVLAVASGVWAMSERRSRGQPPMSEPVFPLAGLFVLGARIGFVLIYLDAYLATPWSIVDVRDGGWHAPSGLVALLLGVAVLVWRRRDRRRALLLTAGSAGLVTAAAATLAMALTPSPPEDFPALALQTADGRAIAFPAERPLVLNLWASWCAPCRREMPTLIEAARQHPAVDFVLLNQGEHATEIGRVLATLAIPEALLAWDPAAEASRELEVRGYPVTLFVDRQGRVIHRHFGALSAGSLAARIEGLQSAR